MSECIFAGSFDIFHNGHIDRIENALKIFEKVHVVILKNESKKYWFDEIERKKMIEKCIGKFNGRVTVSCEGNKMLHDVCHDRQVFNVFRGIKGGRTFDEEIRLKIATNYLTKLEYGEEIFFVYDITSEDDFRGSSIVKLLALNGKSINSLVPTEIVDEIEKKVDDINLRQYFIE